MPLEPRVHGYLASTRLTACLPTHPLTHNSRRVKNLVWPRSGPLADKF